MSFFIIHIDYMAFPYFDAEDALVVWFEVLETHPNAWLETKKFMAAR